MCLEGKTYPRYVVYRIIHLPLDIPHGHSESTFAGIEKVSFSTFCIARSRLFIDIR